MVYLFLGQDSLAKDNRLRQIRKEFLPQDTEQFNLDILYAKELVAKDLQERLLSLPVKNPQRIVVIKAAQELKEEVRAFILEYIKSPDKRVILILDIDSFPAHKSATSQQLKLNDFVSRLNRYAKVFRFQEIKGPDAFTLNRLIDLKKPDSALRVLNQLLQEGERPERILGGLRYAWEKEASGPREMKAKLRLLLNCDLEIKTGRLKPAFALEKLVIGLCGMVKPFC